VTAVPAEYGCSLRGAAESAKVESDKCKSCGTGIHLLLEPISYQYLAGKREIWPCRLSSCTPALSTQIGSSMLEMPCRYTGLEGELL
jgi:hypothetical protein